MSNEKKTIIFMAPTPPPFMGPSIATEIILNSRFTEEFNVIHIDTADRRPLSKLSKIDVTNIYLALKHYFLLIRKLLFNKVDLVYIPVSQTTIGFLRDTPFIIISKLFKKKVVLHLRGGYFREFYNSSGRMTKYIVRKTLKHVDRMIVLGECFKVLFDGLVPVEKLSVVPNGLDVSFDMSEDQSSDNKHLIVLFLANLVETKGFRQVLYSVKKVTQYHSNVKYVFAGSWMKESSKPECERYIEEEKIDDYVHFTGTITGKKKVTLLQDADIFVFPTYFPMEGHPWVIVEAMAVGLPIITTDQGCIKESVIDGENGFIITKRDTEAVTEKIVYLIENSKQREEMGRKSRELYEANFTEEHFVSRMISVVNLTLGIR
ncbi:MAG: glycosyltransferase family 4 protein [Sedimentisphaerales bacterium]